MASGSQDWSSVVWEAASGQVKHKWEKSHQGPVLDVAWRDENTFVTCSTDKTIQYNTVRPCGCTRWNQVLSCAPCLGCVRSRHFTNDGLTRVFLCACE